MQPHRREIPLGIVFSTTGAYATVGRDMRDGALLAIEAVNAGLCGDVRLAPQIVDPGGVLDAYRVACDDLLGRAGIRHLVGCYTSSSRKEIIPVVEKFDALLWYPSHYEGFESCDNVIYGGAAPNQHVVPLAGWALPRYGHDVYCVGSNYVWSWETTRIMRELVEGAGGRVLRERYLPIGATDVDAILREVRDTAPDVVFNTLIGESSYAFYRAYHRLSRQEERFRAERRPILSCTLSEPEVQAIGPGAACGHIACSVYFQSIERAENAAFVRAFQSRFGAHRVTSADAEAAYVTTLLLATSLQAAGTDRVPEVKRATYDCRLAAPQGDVRIDPENNHAWLTPRIGRATADGQFRVEWEAAAPSRPDPYLARLDRSLVVADGARRPPLRLVGRT